jgi:creatinine amidohydrolase
MDKVKLEEMTWREIKEALKKGKKTIIVPIGSIEQHGPHLPTGTDSYTGDILGERIARKLSDALVAPTIRLGCSRHHIEFPGTITLTPETLMRTIKEVCASLARHGFKNIVLMPTHGGNFAPVNAVAPEIARELKVNLVVIADLKELIETMAKTMQAFNVTQAQAGAHSGAAETSLMLACHENLVRRDLIRTGYLGEYTTPTILSKGIKTYSPIGVLGDPEKASREAGEKIINRLVETYVQKIKKQLKQK